MHTLYGILFFVPSELHSKCHSFSVLRYTTLQSPSRPLCRLGSWSQLSCSIVHSRESPFHSGSATRWCMTNANVSHNIRRSKSCTALAALCCVSALCELENTIRINKCTHANPCKCISFVLGIHCVHIVHRIVHALSCRYRGRNSFLHKHAMEVKKDKINRRSHGQVNTVMVDSGGGCSQRLLFKCERHLMGDNLRRTFVCI